MKQSDFKRFSELMMATAEAMDKDLSPQRIAIYFKDLESHDIRALEFAAQAHRRSSVYFPKVAELRDLARAWRPPALSLQKGVETKLLESAEMTEERRQENIRRLRKIMDSVGGLDQKYGTDFSKKSNYDKRMEELEKQKKVIKQMEGFDSGN